MPVTCAGAAPSSAHKLLLSHATHANDDEAGQSWDAARCNRLLRQLQSRLAILRRWQSSIQPSPRESANQARPERVKHTHPKRARRKYTRKNSKQSTKNTTYMPIPQLRSFKSVKPMLLSSPCMLNLNNSPHARGDSSLEAAPSPLPGKYKKPERYLSTEISAQMIELKETSLSDQFKAYEGVFDLVNGLLKSTKHNNNVMARKSLLAMCFRKVPDALEQIEDWDRKVLHDKDQKSTWNPVSASMDLYSQLEAFGDASHKWKPIVIAITSHVIKILRTHIQQRTFIPPFNHVLEDLFLFYHRGEDAASLAAAAAQAEVTGYHAQPPFTGNTILRPFQHIIEKSDQRQMEQCVLEQIANILQAGISVSSLSKTGVMLPWKTGIKHLASPNACPSALNFLYLGIISITNSTAYEEKSDDERTLVNILAGTLNVARNGQSHTRRRLLLLFEKCIKELNVSDTIARDGICFVLAMAKAIIAADDNDKIAATSKAELAASVKACHSHSLRRLTVHLLSAMSRYYNKEYSTCVHESIAQTCAKLDHLNLPAWLSDGLHRATAFHLAQETRDLRDLAYAESLVSINDNDDRTGWRWETGLGEWVLKTPQSAKAATSTTKWKARARVSLPLELESSQYRGGQKRLLEMPARRPLRPEPMSEFERFRPIGYRVKKKGYGIKNGRTVMLLTELAGSNNDLADLF